MLKIILKVVAGDTKTCGIHLDGCLSLIRARRQTDVKLSSKTKALHRIFFYLRVMQKAMPTGCEAESTDGTMASHDNQDGGYQAGSEELETCLDAQESSQGEFDSASWELIYGLPQGLIVLVWKTTKLLQELRHQATNPPAHDRTSTIATMCDQIEDEILDFPVEQAIARLDKAANMSKGNRQILKHHIRAFHQATIIFFSRSVRFMHRRHLQQYVHAVLHHLNEIEAVKARAGINAQPILWPAFVAAAQAIYPAVRNEFARWFERIEQHGVGTSRRTREALEELWRNEDVTSRAQTLLQWPQSHLILT